MASARTVELLFRVVDQATGELQSIKKELQSLQKLQNGYQQAQQQSNEAGKETARVSKSWLAGLGPIEKAVGLISIAYTGVRQAISDVMAVGQKFYNDFILANERLNASVLASASSIAATQAVYKDGIELTDAGDAIAALQPKIKEVLKQVQKDSVDLVGITSAELTGLFQILSSNVSQLSNQSKQGLEDPLDAAGKLTIDFAAALGTLGVPLAQASQEVNSILRGSIDVNSVVGKQLGITNQMVAQWKAQGTLVDNLRNRLSAFTEGNRAASQSISSALGNIRDVYEIVTRQAGEPLLAPVVEVLKSIEAFAKNNTDTFIKFASVITDQLVVAFNNVRMAIAPLVEELIPIFADLFSTVQQLTPILGTISSELTQKTLIPVIKLLAESLQILGTVTQGINDLATIINVRLLGGTEATTDSASKLFSLITSSVPGTSVSLSTIAEIVERIAAIADDPRLQKLLNVATFLGRFAPSNGLGVVNKLLGVTSEEAGRVREGIEGISEEGEIDTSNLEIANRSLAELGSTTEQLGNRVQEGLSKFEDPIDKTELETTAKSLMENVGQAVETGALSAEEAQRILSRIAGDQRLDAATQMAAQKQLTQITQTEAKNRQDAIALEIADIKEAAETGAISRIDAERQVTELQKQQIQSRLEAINEEIARREAAGEDGAALEGLRNQAASLTNELDSLAIESQKRLTQLAIEEGDKRVQALALELKQQESLLLKGEITRSEFEQRSTDIAIKQVEARIAATSEALKTAQASEKRKLSQQLAELNLEREKLAIEGTQKVQAAQLRELEAAQDAALDQVRLAESQRITELERLRLKEPELAARIDRQIADQRKAGTQEALRLEQERLAFLESQGALTGEAEIQRQDQIRAARQKVADLTSQLVQQEAAAQRALTQEINNEIDRRTAKITQALQAQTQEYEKQLELIRLASQAENTRLELLNAQKSLVSSRAALEQTVFNIAIASTEDEGKRARLQEKAGQAKLAAKVRELEIDAQIFEIQEIQRKLELESEKIQARIAQIKSRAALAEAQANAAKILADPAATEAQKNAALLGVQAAQIGVVGADASAQLTDFKAQTNDALSGLKREAFNNQQQNELLNAQFEAAQSIADPGRRNRTLDQLSRSAQQMTGTNANPYVTVVGGGPMSQGQASPIMQGITAGFDQLFGGITEQIDGMLKGFNVAFDGLGQFDPNALGQTQSTSVSQNNIQIGQVNFTNRIERDNDRAQLDGVRQAIANDLSQLFNQAASAA